jgi:phage tail tape-measure protein
VAQVVIKWKGGHEITATEDQKTAESKRRSTRSQSTKPKHKISKVPSQSKDGTEEDIEMASKEESSDKLEAELAEVDIKLAPVPSFLTLRLSFCNC